MADGTTKPIETVKAGDYVYSRDQNTGDTSTKKVLRTFVHFHRAIVDLELSTGEHLLVTPTHPIYILDKGFVPAGQLAIGNAIVTRAGPPSYVVSITPIDDNTGSTVYNFEVEDYHTYFVGTLDGGIWVHNDGDECFLNTHTVTIVDGRKVYKLKDLDLGVPSNVDPTKYVHPKIIERIEKGATNQDLIKSGNAAIGPDGRPINLHHITGEEPGPMIELYGSKHSRYTRQLHNIIEDNHSFRNNPVKNRRYNNFRKRYWKQRN